MAGSINIKLNLTYKITIIIFSALFLFPAYSPAQEIVTDSTGLLQAEEPAGPGFVSQYKVRAGLMPGISLPMGDLGTALGMGFGADLFADGIVPYKIHNDLIVRAGVNLGFYTFSTKNDISASLTVIPLLIGGKVIYPLAHGFSPYGGLAFGLTTNMASGDVAASSYDGTFAINFGTEYSHQSLQTVDFMLDVRYMMAFESVMGQFLSVLVGAAYKFDAGPSEPAAEEPAAPAVEEAPEGEKPVYKQSTEEKFPEQDTLLMH